MVTTTKRIATRCWRPQAAFLAGVFGDGRDVSYPTFLSWATPGPDGLAASGGPAAAGPAYRRGGRQRGRPAAGAAALAALERGGGGRDGESDAWDWKQQQQRLLRQQQNLQHFGGTASGEREARGEKANRGKDEQEEEEAELKVRTALRRMGGEDGGVSRAWEEFERMDPGGRRGGVREEELVEVGLFLSRLVPGVSPFRQDFRIGQRNTITCKFDVSPILAPFACFVPFLAG